jgi:hypothetical protein
VDSDYSQRPWPYRSTFINFFQGVLVVLKRNIAVVVIAGGLLGVQANFAAAHEAGFATGKAAGGALSAKVAYFDGRAKSDIHAGAYGYGESSGVRGSDSSPFPESNSKD